MRETEWAKNITDRLDGELKSLCESYSADTGIRLMYANEITEYEDEQPVYNDMSFETDILIYEWIDNKKWKPRVVIETKLSNITTHDAIVYSNKSYNHKRVHPYLRYGIFIGDLGETQLPGRLFRHGENFDFMITWKSVEPSSEEWLVFFDILKKEINASRKLEELMFDTRTKNRTKYFALHKPLSVWGYET